MKSEKYNNFQIYKSKVYFCNIVPRPKIQHRHCNGKYNIPLILTKKKIKKKSNNFQINSKLKMKI